MSSATPPRIGRVMSIQSGSDEGDDFGGRGPDMYDALRDLFLDGPEEPAAPASAEQPRTSDRPAPAQSEHAYPIVEALVLGHLPVQQSPWVMQYVRDAASQRGGPVALLRVREGEATLDLVGSTVLDLALTPKTTLEDALVAIAPHCRGLIVRVDPSFEPVLPSLSSVDALTLLTGADEAAVVGSYRSIKSLLGNSDEQVPQLRLAIMGSTPDKALPAAEKIQKAVAANLRHEVTVTACLARIAAGRSILMFRGLFTDDLAEAITSARETLSRPRPAPSLRTETPRPVESAPEPLPEPEPLAQPVTSRLGHSTLAWPASPAAPTHPPIARPTPPSTIARPPLASHFPGLSPTAISCPYQPKVEFAIDDRGTLNLLSYAQTPAEHGQAIGTLLAAASWAKSHAALLAMAVPAKTGADRPLALHLLTPAVKDFRGLPEAGIHLHLLARVEVEGKSGWFCTEVG